MSAEANPAIYQVKLKDRHEVAESTMAFRFEKPTHFVFKPGQFIDMPPVDHPETDAAGNVRAFSIASASDEDALMVATRMRHTAFKRVWQTMPLGTEVTIEDPLGNLVLHADAARQQSYWRAASALPRSGASSCKRRRRNDRAAWVLLCSNRRPENAAFLGELQALQRDNPQYTFVGAMTEAEKSHHPWQDERSFVNQRMLAKFLKHDSAPQVLPCRATGNGQRPANYAQRDGRQERRHPG